MVSHLRERHLLQHRVQRHDEKETVTRRDWLLMDTIVSLIFNVIHCDVYLRTRTPRVSILFVYLKPTRQTR